MLANLKKLLTSFSDPRQKRDDNTGEKDAADDDGYDKNENEMVMEASNSNEHNDKGEIYVTDGKEKVDDNSDGEKNDNDDDGGDDDDDDDDEDSSDVDEDGSDDDEDDDESNGEDVDEAEDEEQQKSRHVKDKEIFETTLQRLSHWGERSTFHGIDVLMETPADWRRVLVVAFLLGMSWSCWICLGFLVTSFLNLPISTVINNGQAAFQFPSITLCPNSPFSMLQLQATGRKQFTDYQNMAKFWIDNAHSSPQSKVPFWSPFEAEWRQRVKRSFLGRYMTSTGNLSVAWNQHFVACQYNGEECGLLGVETLQAPTESKVVYHSNTNWLLDPGAYYGYRDEVDSLLQLSIPDNSYDEAYWVGSNEWPSVTPLVFGHPSKYRCFQFRVKSGDVKHPGSISGLHLILKRPYSRNETHPALFYAEGIANIYQGWDDHVGPMIGSDARIANSMDGFTVLIHEDSHDRVGGSLPVDEIFTAGGSRNTVRTAVKFGEHVDIKVSQFIHRRLSQYFRPCKNSMPPIFLIDLLSFFTSDKKEKKYFRIAYTRNNCISSVRQGLIYRRCGCLSEDIFVPGHLADVLTSDGFCHSTLNGDVDKSVLNRSKCHDEVIRMTSKQVLLSSMPKSWPVTVLIQPDEQMELLWLCPQFCQETVNNIERKQILRQVEPIRPNINATVDIEHEDYLTISISAKETRTAIVSEGEQMTLFNLLASIGGTFGLFMGLSGVTAFEVIEAWIIIFRGGFGLVRYSLFLVKHFFVNFLHVLD